MCHPDRSEAEWRDLLFQLFPPDQSQNVYAANLRLRTLAATLLEERRQFAVGAFSVANQRLSQRDNDPACGCVEDLDKGNEDGIDSGQQAEVSADFAAVPTANEIAEVSSR